MVHRFQMHGKYIAYDSESCSIHELDQVADAVLSEYIKNEGKRLSQSKKIDLADTQSVDVSEIDQICDDLNILIGEGALFAQEVEFEYQRLYPDEPKIKAMCLHVCHDCNLRCAYCFAQTGDYGTGRSMLDEKTGRAAIDFLVAASGDRHNLDIDFFGGEPLLNWSVVESLTHYCDKVGQKHNKDIRLTITTNAVTLDEEKTRFINTHMKNCVLSIDGRPEVHDKMRPLPEDAPSYARVSDRIRTFVQHRLSDEAKHHEHYIRGTFTRHNLDFTEDVVHMSDTLGSRYISVEPVVAPDDQAFAIQDGDVERIEQEYEKLALILHARKIEGRPIHFFHFNMDMTAGPCVYKRLKGCGVGAEYCAVTPEGDIYPCHQFVGEDEMRMGNVKDIYKLLDDQGRLINGASVDQILSKKIRKTFFDRLMPNRPACKTCFARYYCGGGCAANRYYSTGSLDSEYELGCRLTQKRLECSIWLTVASSDNNL